MFEVEVWKRQSRRVGVASSKPETRDTNKEVRKLFLSINVKFKSVVYFATFSF